MNSEKANTPASPVESYCVVCDAPVGGCTHGGARYLPEIVYERVEGGWAVRPEDRAVWDAIVARHWKITPVNVTRPLDELISQLDVWIFVSDEMIGQLGDLYERNPARATRMVDALLEGATSGRLSWPDAWLRKMLREAAGVRSE